MTDEDLARDLDPTKTAHVLLIVDSPVLARVIQLALAHGAYWAQVAALFA